MLLLDFGAQLDSWPDGVTCDGLGTSFHIARRVSSSDTTQLNLLEILSAGSALSAQQ